MAENKLNININKDDQIINEYLYCLSKFNQPPNKINIHTSYKINEFKKLIDDISTIIFSHTEIVPNNEGNIVNEKKFNLINDTEIYISYTEYDRESDFGVVSDVIFYHKNYKDKDKVEDIISKIEKIIFESEPDSNCSEKSINILSVSQEGLFLESTSLMSADYENIDLFFNDVVMDKTRKICKSIKKKSKGLTVIYGERGTGKSTLVSYIVSELNKIVIFIPSNLIEVTLNSTDFRSLIVKYKNSVIIIDDAELHLGDYSYTKSNVFSNNLIQMVDGLYSDILNLHIIVILNVKDADEIDSELVECNNLIDMIHVDCLDKKATEDLCQHLSNKNIYNKPKLVEVIKNKKQGKKSLMGY